MSDDTQARAARLTAAANADWMQVVLNQGPPCFHLEEDGTFCLRAERWEGHTQRDEYPEHRFVSLADLLSAHVETLTQQVAELRQQAQFDTGQLQIQAGALNEQAVRVRNLQQENARLTRRLSDMAQLTTLVDARLQQAEQQRDAAHAALREISLTTFEAHARKLADAALAASAPQKEQREPCSACEGQQFDGFICDRCGREHHVAADGTWWSTWPAPAQETER